MAAPVIYAEPPAPSFLFDLDGTLIGGLFVSALPRETGRARRPQLMAAPRAASHEQIASGGAFPCE